jgi:signal recognition particle GTPase
MKVSNEQLNEEVNEKLLPYLMEQSLSLPIIMKCVHTYITERMEDYEWQDNDRVMDIVKEKINQLLAPPSFEERYGPICLN